MKKGVLSAVAAYALWGFFPIYFKILKNVPAFQITAHRIVWSFLLMVLLTGLWREFPALRSAFKGRTLLIYLGASIFVGINWLVYVWAVNAGFIVEASLGYFINPLVSVLFGRILLGEKLRPMQWVPVGLACAGVIFLTVSYGALPWISLVLACSFGLYGLFKKIAPLAPLPGLALETAMIFLPALGYLLLQEFHGVGSFGHAGLLTNLLLALTGVVTAVPLLLFAAASRRVRLTTMGLLQYITPSLQFLIGIFLYNEAFTPARLVGFSIIWLALLFFSTESFLNRRRVIAATPV
jgi:chloramphenicol-sensitive protein RarD